MSDTPPAAHIDELRPIRRVLVCIGLSPESIGGLHLGRQLAKTFGAEVHALHVVEPGNAAHEAVIPGLAERQMAIAGEELGVFLRSHGCDQAEAGAIVQHVRRGAAEEEILRCAAEIDADLLVFGRYGRGGLKRERLGSVASRLVRQSPVCVLLAQPEYRAEAITKVGVACEFETDPDPAVERAGEVCRRLGVGAMTLLHAYDLPVGYHTIMTEEQVVEAIKTVARERAEMIAERMDARGGPAIKLHTELGSVGEQVTRMAEMENLDLLVFASHHRSRSAMFLLPRTTEKILAGLHCSAWIERGPGLHEGALEALKEIVTGS